MVRWLNDTNNTMTKHTQMFSCQYAISQDCCLFLKYIRINLGMICISNMLWHRSCEKWRSIRLHKLQEERKHPTKNNTKVGSLDLSCLALELPCNGKIERRGRRGRKRKHLLYDLTERGDTGIWICGDLALEKTTDLPQDRSRNEWMNEWMNKRMSKMQLGVQRCSYSERMSVFASKQDILFTALKLLNMGTPNNVKYHWNYTIASINPTTNVNTFSHWRFQCR